MILDEEPVGWLAETKGGVEFRYDAAWVARSDAQPISLTIPLREEPFVWRTVHPFFLGLLPEGWLLSISLSTLKLARDDTFGLVLQLCRDCVGAVRVLPAEGDPRGDTG